MVLSYRQLVRDVHVRRSIVLGYGLAVLASSLALIVSLLLWPAVRLTPFFLIFAAVALNAWFGGLGPGLLATALCTLGGVFLFPPLADPPVLDEPGTVVRYGTFLLIALIVNLFSVAQRVAQRRAETAQQHYRAVVDSVLDGLITTSEQGIIHSFNPAAERIFGYRAAEVVGRSVKLLIAEPHASEHGAFLQHYLQTGNSQIIGTGREVVGRRRDGSTFPADLAVSDVHLDRQRLFVAIARDVTERKQMEEQLLRAQRLEAAGRIAGQVAHDFNNMLALVVAYPELIKMQLPPDHPAVAACDAMTEAGERMSAINDDLLALGRRGGFEREPLDLNGVVGLAVAELANRPAALTLDLRLAPDLRPVSGSEAQLLRVLTNLATNARDAMDDAGRLTITTENVSVAQPVGRTSRVEPGEYVRVSVSDTGPGIPAEARDQMFDAFFTTKRAGKRHGTGLGLTIVQTVVEDHQGTVDFESEAGKWTTFHIYLPVCRP